MTRLALANYAALGATLASWLGVMWGLDYRIALCITAATALVVAMSLHADARCPRTLGGTRRCALRHWHTGDHVTPDGEYRAIKR